MRMTIMPNSLLRGSAAGVMGLLLSAGAVFAEARVFDSPEAAAEAVAAAIDAEDVAGLLAIFGPENEDVVFSGDDDEDRADWTGFLKDYRTLHRISPSGEGVETLYVGRDLWPFPAPIVEGPDGWVFDAAAAREEVLLRRIGENELEVIDLLGGYVQVQRQYRITDPDDDGLPTFADSILSDPGRRNGLYWDDSEGGPESPLGEFMARAAAGGYSLDGEDVEPDPYAGYYFRILTRQGPNAPGGEFDYMVGDHMVAGHAMLAYPAAYGDTGVMSFMVGEAGVIYEADLGEETLDVAGAMTSFDPGVGWTPVEE